MDGVPGATQDPVASGNGFTYEFETPIAGSFMDHAHVGVQLDRGLHGPLVVGPRTEELAYDREYTVTLDDWQGGLDGRRHPGGHGSDAAPEAAAALPADEVSVGGCGTGPTDPREAGGGPAGG